MKLLDNEEDKVKKICEVLKRETLEPAKKEADAIISKAKEEAEKIVNLAKREAQKTREESEKKNREKQNIFESSLNLACKKTLATLKEEIEKKLLNPGVEKWVDEKTRDPQLLAKLISAIVTAVENEGIEADLKALIPHSVSPQEVNRELMRSLLARLKEGSVEIGDFEGGVELKIVDQNITIDMTNHAMKSLVASFVRDDFRSVIFGKF